MHMRSNVSPRYSKIELMEMYKTSSKYLWVGMELISLTVTATSVSIIKCMKKYGHVINWSFRNDATLRIKNHVQQR